MATGIPIGDIPTATPDNADSVLGFDAQTGKARRFSVGDLTSDGVSQAELDEQLLSYLLTSNFTWTNLQGKPSTFTPSTHTHADATNSTAGFIPASAVVKLAGIENGATANRTDTATDSAITSAITTHNADSTSVHGIADTSLLITKDDNNDVTLPNRLAVGNATFTEDYDDGYGAVSVNPVFATNTDITADWDIAEINGTKVRITVDDRNAGGVIAETSETGVTSQTWQAATATRGVEILSGFFTQAYNFSTLPSNVRGQLLIAFNKGIGSPYIRGQEILASLVGTGTTDEGVGILIHSPFKKDGYTAYNGIRIENVDDVEGVTHAILTEGGHVEFQAAATQTNPAFTVKDASGEVALQASANGITRMSNTIHKRTTAPDDADLSNGEFAFYLDGSTLHVKMRDVDGVVSDKAMTLV